MRQTSACHPRSPTLVFHCTDEVTEVQRGAETASGLHSKYFRHRESEDGQEERESEVREVVYLSIGWKSPALLVIRLQCGGLGPAQDCSCRVLWWASL